MDQPSISVALCTYNGATFLEQQLRSLSAQTLPPAELIVCDDGSTDGTIAIAEQFIGESPFPVRLVRQPDNLGVTRNFASALALCQGPLIALCDQDDVWLPDKLQQFAEFFQLHPGCLAAFSDATVVDEQLKPFVDAPSLWQQVGLTPDLQRQIARPATSLRTLANLFLVTGATLVVQRELLHYALPIPAELPTRMIHDGWLAVVAAALGKLAPLSRPTMLYRQHSRQQVGLVKGKPLPRALSISRDQFLMLATEYRKLHDALHERVADQSVPGVLAEVQHRVDFFQTRGTLPEFRIRRIKPVLTQWRRGGYRCYCRQPLLAALRDLIF